MSEHLDIFTHARASALVDDPHGVIERGAEDGTFAQPCTLPSGSPAIVAALESNGRMPVDGMRGGAARSQLVIVIVASVLIAIGLGLFFLANGTGSSLGGTVMGLIGALLWMLAWVSARKRIQAVGKLSQAWNSGWVRFAPARVGGVWISGVTRHGNRREDRDTEYRFRYRALVEVYPSDGTEPFQFHSSEFTALADRNGQPLGLKMVEGPLDHFEPEFSNGWTVARWIAGEVDSATITTDLSTAQIKAALKAAGVR